MKLWTEMSPRERDELVAEKVMGWTKDGRPGFWYDPARPEAFYGAGYTHDGSDYDFEDFKPTQDITAAWEVVEKMRDEGFWFFVGSGSREHGRIVAEFRPKGEEGIAAVTDDTPEAICLAALRARGIDV